MDTLGLSGMQPEITLCSVPSSKTLSKNKIDRLSRVAFLVPGEDLQPKFVDCEPVVGIATIFLAMPLLAMRQRISRTPCHIVGASCVADTPRVQRRTPSKNDTRWCS